MRQVKTTRQPIPNLRRRAKSTFAKCYLEYKMPSESEKKFQLIRMQAQCFGFFLN